MLHVVANQFWLILQSSILRNFSAFEERIDIVLVGKTNNRKFRKGEGCDSEKFQWFAEKVRKNRVFDEFGMSPLI